MATPGVWTDTRVVRGRLFLHFRVKIIGEKETLVSYRSRDRELVDPLSVKPSTPRIDP